MINPLTGVTLKGNQEEWLRIIKYKESGVVLQIQDDCEYYIPLVIKANKDKNLKLFYLKANQKDWIKKIEKLIIENKKQRVGVFISHVTPWLKPKKLLIWYKLEELIRKNNLSVVIFSEQDLTSPKFNELVNYCSGLFANIIYYPLYGMTDRRQFIEYKLESWQVKLSSKIKEHIAVSCGGQLWLASQMLRYYRNNSKGTIKDAEKDELLKKKVLIFWSKFSKKEKEIIRNKILNCLSNKDKQTHEFEYLNKIKALNVPLLKLAIETELKENQLSLRRGGVYLKKRLISQELTRNEELILRLLIKKKNKLVEREELAEAIWGKMWPEKYSDWAIDRLIFRLRQKLVYFGLDRQGIRVIKGKGVVWE